MRRNYTYDAFGKLEGRSGYTENSYQFAGEQFDKNLNEYYLRQRYYDQNTGRFTRRDTYEGRAGEPLTLHKYGYTHSNPVNFIDPSGLMDSSMQDLGAAIGVLAILAVYAYVTNAYDPEALGGFGAGSQPDVPRNTGRVLDRLLDFGKLGGFGEDYASTYPTHTGHPQTADDLVQYVFSVWDETAYDIAFGHAWRDHIADSWMHVKINTQQELAEHIDNVITFPTESKKLRRGRKAYWHDLSGTLVIVDPGDTDGGTAYRPSDGKAEYDRLQ